MLAVAGVAGLYGNLGCAWQMCRSNGVSETALIYNNYNTATIGTMSRGITYYSDTGTNTPAYNPPLPSSVSQSFNKHHVKAGWLAGQLLSCYISSLVILVQSSISNGNDTCASPLTLLLKISEVYFTGEGSNCVTANLMLIVVNVCYEWKIIHWSQSPGINLLGFVQCVFIQLLSRGIYYGPFGYCSTAHNGKLEIYCEPKQRESRGRTSYMGCQLKLGQAAEKCGLWTEHFKTG